MLITARYVAKNHDSSFAPTPNVLIKFSRTLNRGEIPNAELAWQKPKETELSRKAWELWGGDARWGALPDPKYSENPQSAQTILSFAQKEFINVYNGLLEQENKQQDLLAHSDSKTFFEKLGGAGVDVRRLLG